MTEITRISKTKRGRFALFCGEEFLFSVDEETYVKNSLKEGTLLESTELSALKSQSDTQKAKESAFRYLSIRAYGQKELYDKLLLKYDEHSAAAAMAVMCDAGLMDDDAFAQAKAQAMAQRGKSPFEIRQKLLALGINQPLAESAVAALDIDGEQAALSVVKKGYMEKLRAGRRPQVMAALARRGFSHREICGALAVAEAELEGTVPQEDL